MTHQSSVFQLPCHPTAVPLAPTSLPLPKEPAITLLPLASSSAIDQPNPSAAVSPLPRPRAAIDTFPLQHLFDAPTAAALALASAGRGDRDAIAWLSEHLATLDRVIYPVAARHLPAASAALHSQRHLSRTLALLLRRLHAQLDGDGATAAEDVASLRRAVLAALREHTAGDREMTAELRAALTAQQWQDLTGRYTSRLQRGPTRPHPHTPRTGLSGRLAYRVSALVDRTLDVLDSRAIRSLRLAR